MRRIFIQAISLGGLAIIMTTYVAPERDILPPSMMSSVSQFDTAMEDPQTPANSAADLLSNLIAEENTMAPDQFPAGVTNQLDQAVEGIYQKVNSEVDPNVYTLLIELTKIDNRDNDAIDDIVGQLCSMKPLSHLIFKELSGNIKMFQKASEMENTLTSPSRSQRINLTMGSVGPYGDYEQAYREIENNPDNRLDDPSNQAIWKLIKTAIRVNDQINANSAITIELTIQLKAQNKRWEA
ncbi:hypothetical protein BJ085DRAFT_35147 [Dimargaris cristalligena]|uniref:Uncharacterized protein n=1 Tax=Dimargaris cristalligena TaxID=215637 RepID=A0A4P9ZR28_9FUNG|nr:hypothetical protein BJ085DRAFT_35147 [Dimargaris cristalligena]|eukprot:RKP35837.1 hypothetical protein BJ085DRAFT_35147 [Dimargaris cristalligena]